MIQVQGTSNCTSARYMYLYLYSRSMYLYTWSTYLMILCSLHLHSGARYTKHYPILLIYLANLVESWQLLQMILEIWINNQLIASHAFFVTVSFSKINSFAYVNSPVMPNLYYLIFKMVFINIKYVMCLFINKHNYLNILTSIFIFVCK